jgi:agmatine/peptidylarginine deiminase
MIKYLLLMLTMTLITSCSLDPDDTPPASESPTQETTDTGVVSQESHADSDDTEIASIDEESVSLIDTAEAKISAPYHFPDESEPHAGTWLQWPHEHQYGRTYRDRLDSTWVDMTRALITGEKVFIIAYDATEQTRITALLEKSGIPMANIDFTIAPTDDVWVRDNGPIYVHDRAGKLVIQDWGFNGWGDKAESKKCDAIPEKIAKNQKRKHIDLSKLMVNE